MRFFDLFKKKPKQPAPAPAPRVSAMKHNISAPAPAARRAAEEEKRRRDDDSWITNPFDPRSPLFHMNMESTATPAPAPRQSLSSWLDSQDSKVPQGPSCDVDDSPRRSSSSPSYCPSPSPSPSYDSSYSSSSSSDYSSSSSDSGGSSSWD